MTAPREFLNETQERFLKGVLAKIPITQVAELYLFQPIKQGGVESGVAVIASVPEAPPAPEPSEEAAAEPAGQGTADAGAVAELEVLDDAGAGAELGVVEEPAAAEGDAEAGADAEAVADPEAEADADAEAVSEGDADSDADPGEDLASDLDDDELADVEPEPIDTDEEYPSQVAARYTVYSANYRLVLKGPDRGKWALDVTAEADAPLITLESVVRGVQQRSGDVEPPRRYDQAELRAFLRIPAPEASPPAAP
ncbi:MAG: hypothetical protein ACYC4J_12030 [Gemmatimonadaceae bacterium]